ncbi:MAG: putative quinol monooxygenase [Roseobacter sp.]
MFAVTVTITTHPEKTKDFLPLILKNAQLSLSHEQGCLQFDVATEPSRPGAFFLYELYTDAAAFDAHLASAHFLEFDQATAAMIAKKSIATFSEVRQ